jgi:UDP-N-acetylmuramate dehydrogenase
MKISEKVTVAGLTTMRLGGPAKYVVEITTPEEINQAYQFAEQKNLPVYVLGGGSNIIGRDEGFQGVLLRNRLKGIEIISESADGITLRAMSGETLDDLVDYAVQRGYSGVEALSAIPGAVGGAIMQNSGAYGQQLSDSLESVEAYDTAERQMVTLNRAELGFSYRTSIFNTAARGRYFVISGTVKLSKGQITQPLFQSLQDYLDQHAIADRDPATIRRAVTDIRAHKLPDPTVQASAGSFFKNYTIKPSEVKDLQVKFPGIPIFQIGDTWEIASGWLIEQAGLKGQLLHGMRVSDQAALVLINESAQSYADLAAARSEIIAAVRAKFGFTLQQEPEEI